MFEFKACEVFKNQESRHYQRDDCF